MTATGGSLERDAVAALVDAFGGGPEPATGVAPGRLTLVGEHVDYVGGRIVCCAIDLFVAVAARPSGDARWRVVSAGRRAERERPEMHGDIGDRILSAAVVLMEDGVGLPPLEIAAAATLPEAAGLSSSAAVTCATLVALLRLAGEHRSAERLIALALRAEREVVGVPCGPLDQNAVIASPADGALLLDCARDTREAVPWPGSRAVIVVADSGEPHDVGAGEYRERRESAEGALRLLGVPTCQEIGDRWHELDGRLRRRARHVATETRRSDAAVGALRHGDLVALGRLLSESHASLRDDCEVSTPQLDALVGAAAGVPGCHGARLVGAGFGGSVIALCDEDAAEAVRAAMLSAGARAAWQVRPSPGVAVLSPDVAV